jgi:predicted dehydrogenase
VRPESRYLVVGSGSVARRHLTNLKRLFPEAEIGCVSASGRRLDPADVPADRLHEDLASACASRPVFAVVASPATLHVEHAAVLLAAGIPVLVEKPLASSTDEVLARRGMLEAHRHRIEVAYTLRHLASGARMKAAVDEGVVGRVHGVLTEVGQYLPDWRPGTDYRRHVTARSELGGGVLLELSHEIDYLAWLFGDAQSVYCASSTSGSLEIDVEDRVDAILRTKAGAVLNLHMDLLQRAPVRCCKVIGEQGNLVWNLATDTVTVQRSTGEDLLFDGSRSDRNDMYVAQLRRFARVAAGELAPLVGLAEAMRTLQVVEAMKRSARSDQVVRLDGAAP